MVGLFTELIFESLINDQYLKNPSNELIALRSTIDQDHGGDFLKKNPDNAVDINIFDTNLNIKHQIQLKTNQHTRDIEFFKNHEIIKLIIYNQIIKIDNFDRIPVYQTAKELINGHKPGNIESIKKLHRRYRQVMSYLNPESITYVG